MNNKFLSLLGMARKANKLALGYDKSLDMIHKGAARAVFCASDLSEKTKRGLVFAAEESTAQVVTVPFTVFDITCAVGQKTGIAAVSDAGFSKKLLSLLEDSPKQ